MDKQAFLEKIGENIVKIRKQKSLKQFNLADKANMKDSSLRRIEKGRVNSTIIMLKRVADALEVPLIDLLKY